MYPTYGGRGTWVRRVPHCGGPFIAPRAVVAKGSVGWADSPLRGPALRNGRSGLRPAALWNLHRRDGGPRAGLSGGLVWGLSGGCREAAEAGEGLAVEGMCGPPCETSATSWGPMFSSSLLNKTTDDHPILPFPLVSYKQRRLSPFNQGQNQRTRHKLPLKKHRPTDSLVDEGPPFDGKVGKGGRMRGAWAGPDQGRFGRGVVRKDLRRSTGSETCFEMGRTWLTGRTLVTTASEDDHGRFLTRGLSVPIYTLLGISPDIGDPPSPRSDVGSPFSRPSPSPWSRKTERGTAPPIRHPAPLPRRPCCPRIDRTTEAGRRTGDGRIDRRLRHLALI